MGYPEEKYRLKTHHIKCPECGTVYVGELGYQHGCQQSKRETKTITTKKEREEKQNADSNKL